MEKRRSRTEGEGTVEYEEEKKEEGEEEERKEEEEEEVEKEENLLDYYTYIKRSIISSFLQL